MNSHTGTTHYPRLPDRNRVSPSSTPHRDSMKITIPSRGAAPPAAAASTLDSGAAAAESELEDGESQSPEAASVTGLGKRKRRSSGATAVTDGQSATATASSSRAQGDTTRSPAVQLFETMRDYRKE